jgi:hypothetical protein
MVNQFPLKSANFLQCLRRCRLATLQPRPKSLFADLDD